MSTTEIKQIKSKMEGFNTNTFIKEMLVNSKEKFSKNADNKFSKDAYIEDLKKNSVNIFLENLKNKSVKEVTNQYTRSVEDFSKATQLYCDKKAKEK